MTLLRFLTLALLVCCGHAEATLTRGALDAKVDALVTEGEEHPAQAIAALTQLQREHGSTIDERRMLLLALGSVEAMAGRAAQAAAFAELLLTLAADDASGRALAASNLVRADIAYVAGQHDLAAALAQSALPAFMAGCAPPSGSAASQPPAPAATCDYRPAWHALELLELRARAKGLPAAQATHARTALGLAEAAGDLARQARNLSSLAQLAQARGEHDTARQFMARARRLVQQGNEPAERARFYNADAGLAEIRGDSQAALQARQAALAAAVLADAPRLEARMLNNLSDAYSRLGRPADALRAAERAMPIVRRHNDVRVERLLIVNIGIAKIRLGRIAEGKQDLARVLELWHQSGETGFEVETLVDFGEALAVAGDARGAVELFHRERALSAELMQRNRSVALKELQTRNEAQARQRDIELLGRDNALKTEALATRDLTQRIWWALAAVMALAIAVAR